jgi:hypothetical protein
MHGIVAAVACMGLLLLLRIGLLLLLLLLKLLLNLVFSMFIYGAGF